MSDTPQLDWKLTMPKAMHEAWTAAGKPEPVAWLWAEIARLREFEAAVLHIQEKHLHCGVIDFEITPHATILEWFREQQKGRKV